MPQTAVNELLFHFDEAISGEAWHSLSRNLRAVTAADWDWVPPDGRRSIREIVDHVGGAIRMYEHYAFGDATVPYEYLPFTENRAVDTLESAMLWLEAGYASFRGRIAVLDDAQLDEHRPTHLKPRPIRWIASIML